MRRRKHKKGSANALTPIVVGAAAGALILFAMRNLLSDRSIMQPEDAPRRTWRRRAQAGWGSTALVGQTVTINRPRHEVYARWRDFSRFPEFMENVRSVTILDQTRSRWEVEGPGGSTVEFESRITEERPDELIAWETDEDSQVRSSGQVVFRDAPGGRGTQVEAIFAYEPPAGTVGRLAAKIFQREPQIQTRRELRRFKQLMETGEVAVATPGASAPRA